MQKLDEVQILFLQEKNKNDRNHIVTKPVSFIGKLFGKRSMDVRVGDNRRHIV